MSISAQRFAKLLGEAIYRVRFREDKPIQVVQDELGYALGKAGGSAIEYWRKGHVPQKASELEALARELVARGGFATREQMEQFLLSGGYPSPSDLCDRLFPCDSAQAAIARKPSPAGPPRPAAKGSGSGLSQEDLAPFVVGPPIIHPRQFFGREAELKRIFDLWRRFPLQNVAVIGLHRSGKTSLLHYLKNITTTPPAQLRPGQRTDWLPQPERYRWVFVDFQDSRMCSQGSLLRYLLTSLEMPIPDPCDLSTFMDVVSHRLQNPTLILMDEVGAGLAAPELDQQFWWSLRSLASSQTDGNLGFLLTCHTLPAQLSHEYGKPSPFFNIFGHTLTLGPLTEEEALALIASSPQPFDAADAAWIVTESGRWPALLQILCHTRLTWLECGRSDDKWKEEGLAQVVTYRHLLGSQ